MSLPLRAALLFFCTFALMFGVAVALLTVRDGTRDGGELVGKARVIDGDTIAIATADASIRIRLYGIDAPEARQSCERGGAAWPCGADATDALAARIGDRQVACRGRTRDRYARLIAVCSVGGADLNAWMVRSGWALAYRAYAADYVADEAAAEAAAAGIWAGSFVAPWDWRRRPTVVAAAANGGDIGGDRDCGDFATHSAAQAFFAAAGPGDPHRLDGDGDGIACEALRR